MSGFIKDTFKKSILGGGVVGSQPSGGLFQDAIVGNDRSIDRNILRKSFGNFNNAGLGGSPLYLSNNGGSKCGPFRCAFNAGDFNGTVNEASNKKYGIEHNQANGNRYAMLNINNVGLKRNGNAAYSGNPKTVYDTSDYVRYLKLATKNKNYNDLSTGGDNHHASQTARARIKM